MSERDGYEEDQQIRWTVDSETGYKIKELIMLFDNTLHCDHQPAYREFHHLTGKTLIERWYQNGKPHRLAQNQPTETVWSAKTGFVLSETYMQRGNLHREHHKPAKIFYDEDKGTLKREEFWLHNKLHRDHALPAIIEFDDYRKITHCEFYRNGIKIIANTNQLTP